MSAKKVADALGGVLADTYVLFTKTQNYHWNVVGPYFHSLHLLFESQYQELFTAIDEIAERIRQIGHPAPGTQAEFLKLTVLSEAEAGSAPGMVADLAACNEKVASRVSACLKVAEADGDDGTVDLMVKRLEALSKAGWMLRATLGEEATTEVPVARPAAKSAPVAKTTKVAKAKKKTKTPKAKAPVKAAAAAKPVAKAAAKPVAKAAPKTVAKESAPKAAVKPATKSAPKTKSRPGVRKATPVVAKPAKKKGRVALG